LIINVRVTPNSKQPSVTKLSDGLYEVAVDERAEGGRANRRLIEILSENLDVPKSSIRILRGARSKDKVVQV
jgi:uncharacterized protein YggU (UPF0235/DUF167 family)